ncbi:hypothetical protein N7449_011877 [Penicillium cf. viridicatum]|uniref:Uncharacterized protein n=1 Tax=Penicillium cf. viridicatum TaxID=2972119 RepID=A0A9W9IND7_9EURO|nr:hypothetical protein N7449_011877 [Penicillium cf. viridicatum]
MGPNLPQPIVLMIETTRTTNYDRDIYRLFISYLTAITLLHLKQSSGLLPRASSVAIVAASCVIRLFEDYLARGNIRFLSGEAGWEITIALLALLDARRHEDLRSYVEANISILRAAPRQMESQWPSSRLFAATFDKLHDQSPPKDNDKQSRSAFPIENVGEATTIDDPQWLEYFPFRHATNKLAHRCNAG